jgi:hypothetical protein
MVHELTAESRTYEIPGFGPYRTSIDGVLELEHPYVDMLVRGKALVAELQDELMRQVVTALNGPELLDVINRQFVDPVLLSHPIRVVEMIQNPVFSSFSLFNEAGHAVASATSYRYIGFTLAGGLAVRDASGTTWEVPVHWPGASLSLRTGPDLPPQLEGDLKTLQVYPRELRRELVGRLLQREAVADLVYDLITVRPPTELAHILDHRLKVADLVYDQRELPEGYEPAYRIGAFAIDTIDPSHVMAEKNYVSVKATGSFAVDGHSGLYPFTVFLCLSLTGLGQGRCEQVENSGCKVHLMVPSFEYQTRMDRPEVSGDEAVIMHFTVTNRLPKTNVFLIWHTPLEGFRNEFLDIVHLESGEAVQYKGILASRAAPSRENGSYIELEAGASRSTTIDLREAYTFSRPGTYRVTFRQMGGKDDESPVSTEFVLKAPAAMVYES